MGKPISAIRAKSTPGFTLVELLVVIAVIGVLAALLMPIIGKIRSSAQGSKTVSNLRQIQLANIGYSLEHDGSYVPVRRSPENAGRWWWSSNNAAFPRWFENPDFTRHLGDPSSGWPPVARSGMTVAVKNGSTVYTDGRMTVGWNNTDLFTGNLLGGNLPPKFAFRATDIPEPNRLIAFAECNDWMVTFDKLGKWKPEYDRGETNPDVAAPAFRNGDCVTVVTFSGAVQKLTMQEASEFDRWSLRAPRYQ